MFIKRQTYQNFLYLACSALSICWYELTEVLFLLSAKSIKFKDPSVTLFQFI